MPIIFFITVVKFKKISLLHVQQLMFYTLKVVIEIASASVCTTCT